MNDLNDSMSNLQVKIADDNKHSIFSHEFTGDKAAKEYIMCGTSISGGNQNEGIKADIITVSKDVYVNEDFQFIQDNDSLMQEMKQINTTKNQDKGGNNLINIPFMDRPNY